MFWNHRKCSELIGKLKKWRAAGSLFFQSSLSAKGIELNNGEIIDYIKISKISTDDFKAFEKASKRSEKKGSQHIKVEFTGDENVYALQLEKLQKRRTGAHAARATGGVLAIIGAL